jgi:hypothetical protein
MANTATPRSNNFNGWFYDAVTPAMKFYNRGTHAGAVTTTGAHTFSSTTTLGGVAYTWPGTDGSANDDLNTNGSGTLSWAA